MLNIESMVVFILSNTKVNLQNQTCIINKFSWDVWENNEKKTQDICKIYIK